MTYITPLIGISIVTSPDFASEWVLFCAKWTILQQYNVMNKLYFGEMMIIFACTIQTRLFEFL